MIQVVQKGYRLGDHVLRPARVVVSRAAGRRQEDEWLMAIALRVARRSEERLAGRDQEGVPQARARGPPGQEPGRRGRGGALQGGAGRLRRPLGSREAQAVRLVRLGERRGPGPATNVDFGDFDLGDIFGGLFGGAGGGAGGAAAAARPARQRRRGRGAHLLRGLAASGLQTTVPVELELACHTCHGTGAAPGTAPKRCPQCDGTRRRCDLAGPVRAPAAVPALPRERHRSSRRRARRATARAVSGGRSATPCKIPAGVKDGTQDQAARARARQAGAARRPAICTWSRASSRRSSTSGAATTSSLEVPVTFGEAALGATVEIPTPDGRVSLKVPVRLRRTASCCGSRAAARRS